WQPLWAELVARGRAQPIVRDGVELWCATEGLDDARLALDGDDAAAVRMVRGHLELAGITTVADLAETTSLTTGQVASALAGLEQEGFALQGRYRPAADQDTAEWVARRLLARMHRYSRRARRDTVQA